MIKFSSTRNYCRDAGLCLLASIGLALSAVLLFQLDKTRSADPVLDQEALYASAETVRSVTFPPLRGLVADWYWMRVLQYFGKKLVSHKGDLMIDDLRSLNLKLIRPMLDTTVRLDPQFIAAYDFGGVILPSIDAKLAVEFLERGIKENPSNWRLYHRLGYIYWQSNDYRNAITTFLKGSEISNAPVWMKAMAARIEAEGGSRNVAREMYFRIYEQTNDSKIKEMALKRLAQIQSFDERDLIRKAISIYRMKSGECPKNWRDLTPILRRTKLRLNSQREPLDPAGTPYILTSECDVDLDHRSEVPYR
jgi:hypothetical protein